MSFLKQIINIQPKYTPEHCLVVKHAMGGCEECQKICPHEAITIKRQVEIAELDCSGCGLCVHACPSQALEPSISYQTGAPLKCSQVKGNAQSIHCLGRLQASDILRLAGKNKKVTLVRNNCADCPIGNQDILRVLEVILAEAKILMGFIGHSLTTEVLELEKFSATDLADKISRREFLRGGFRNLQASTADLLAPLENLANEEDNFLPTEHNKKLKFLKLADLAPETEVPWSLPRVEEGCILCPVCTNVCPTNAFSREFLNNDGNQQTILKLVPERCNGCDACTTSCPIKVITLAEKATWQEISVGERPEFYSPLNKGYGVYTSP